ncbi:MAG TPA: hypothetical protein VHB20_00165 [Verrucomicrobiae bacterium]|nr:hypothetical protein [Verrucomicrobiae bacterium]
MSILLFGWIVILFHQSFPLLQYRPPHQDMLPYMVAIDDDAYKAMAEGKTSTVDSPFTKRFLYPYLAKSLTRLTGAPLPTICLALNLSAWTLLAVCVTAVLVKTTGQSWWAAIFLMTPMPSEALLLAYMPEVFHMALVSLFFLLLWSRRDLPALAALLLAFFTRESTLLLCVALFAVAWWRGERRLALGSAVTLVAGMVAGSMAARLGRPNIYALPDVVYLALKVGYNSLRDYCGVMFWTNVDPTRIAPSFTWPLPAALQWGKVREIGVRFLWDQPLLTLVSWAAIFGCAPLVAWRWREVFRTGAKWPLAVRVAFVYGGVAYLIGPGLGASVQKLVGAGWPIVWIAMPWVLSQAGLAMSRGEAGALAGCYLIVAWEPYMANSWRFDDRFFYLLIIVAFYFVANRLLARVQSRSPRHPEAASSIQRIDPEAAG